jgi:osmotically-inducible protein OsmY
LKRGEEQKVSGKMESSGSVSCGSVSCRGESGERQVRKALEQGLQRVKVVPQVQEQLEIASALKARCKCAITTAVTPKLQAEASNEEM